MCNGPVRRKSRPTSNASGEKILTLEVLTLQSYRSNKMVVARSFCGQMLEHPVNWQPPKRSIGLRTYKCRTFKPSKCVPFEQYFLQQSLRLNSKLNFASSPKFSAQQISFPINLIRFEGRSNWKNQLHTWKLEKLGDRWQVLASARRLMVVLYDSLEV